jgi:external thioesterase TEII
MNRPQLFLLHFAGGDRRSFQFLKPLLPEFHFVALELPGRGKRMQEKPLHDFEEAIDDLSRQIFLSLRSPNFLLYGHSMGATMALRIAYNLEAAGAFPLHLIVSGNPGPGIQENKKRYLMEKEEFRREIKKMGGMSDELLYNEELFAFFEPLLKADFALVERMGEIAFRPVQTPIYAMMGNEEEHSGDIGNWKSFTSSACATRLFPGNHFFIYQHAESLARTIKNCYDADALKWV